MSHVDEGTLHAYLDGELPSGERAALESHLGQCAACRTQLGEERALLERSTALLGATRPVDRTLPPFEQVRRAPGRPWYMRTGFAWAASLALAVGLGYYLADARPRPEPANVGPAPVATAVSESAQTDPLIMARQENAPEQKTAGARRATTPAPQSAPESTMQPVEVARFGDKDSQSSVTLRGSAPPPFDTTRRQHNALEEVVVTAAPSAGAESRAAAAPSARRADGRSVRNLVSTSWPVISHGKAASLLGDRPVGVPGLATRGIRSSPGGDTVVVEQALDAKTVIQIFQRPASVTEGNDYGARDRSAQILARYVGRLRVEISGPVSTDSLNKLLEQVEPIP